ncbi:CDGSH iron-sulfur domain-containing protein [Pseudomonadota bacterium]
MSEAKIADTQPAAVELEAGKTYYFCTCGKAMSQPFCDGSHQGSDFTPLVFEADKSGTQYLCQCKRTNNAPFCDGSHKALT